MTRDHHVRPDGAPPEVVDGGAPRQGRERPTGDRRGGQARLPMARLVIAEFQKLFTTKLWLWLLLGAVVLTTLYVSLSIGFGDQPGNPNPPLSSPAGQRTLLALAASGAGPLLAVLATIGFTGELRHRTASVTFLATPRRHRVVAAKLTTYAIVGVGFAVICAAVAIAISLPWLKAKGIEVSPADNGIPATLAGVVIAVALFGVIGVGLGALVRDQVAAVVGLLLYLFVVEPLVTRIPALHGWTIYLPGAAEKGLIQMSQTNLTFLEPWSGGLVFAGYGLVLAIAGTLLTARRDVT